MIQLPINAIIFDLGGVLLNLDFNKSFKAFEELGVPDFPAYFHQSHSNPLFANLEMGLIEPEAFYEAFQVATGIPATNLEIRSAWNAMLLDFREDSVAYLRSLKGNYRLFLLSNTNQIHLEAFRGTYHRTYGAHDFDVIFEKAWYSHELGMRKPGVAIYKEVIKIHGLNPAETLFVDDTAPNIEGAKEAGLQTLLLEKGMLIEQVMPGMLGTK